jgi:pimeloyl-ACP methyl ester carboxylesterase
VTGVVRLGVLCAGLVALAVGVGLGPPHHAAEGLGPVALTGYLLLAGGLVASLWAAGRILRSTRRRWWAPVVALLLVAASLTLWTLGQAVVASFPPRPSLDGRTPADVGLAYRDVTFPSSDGVALAGWYVPSRNRAAVVLMHGAGSTRSAVLDHARVLADRGYGVLLFDARGHGESAGRGMDFGWYGESDASGAVDFLAERPDVEPGRVGLVGMSMGGEQAIGAAGADERVRAVVAEGATHRVAEDKAYLDAYGVRGALQQRVDRVTYGLAGLLTSAPEPVSLRRSVSVATRRPDPAAFLLIAAGEVPDESLAADHVQAGSSTGVATWTVAGAGHTQGLATAPDAWEERVVAFLDDALDR